MRQWRAAIFGSTPRSERGGRDRRRAVLQLEVDVTRLRDMVAHLGLYGVDLLAEALDESPSGLGEVGVIVRSTLACQNGREDMGHEQLAQPNFRLELKDLRTDL